MAKLNFKLHITGDITVNTGLHIGGSEVDLDIGGIDKEVIKVKHGNSKVPYIPGSSLKGKLRSLIARQKGFKTLEDDKQETKSLFAGNEAAFEDNNGRTYYAHKKKHHNDKLIMPSIPSRLIVRDNYLKDIKGFNLEDKAENTINRLTGEANPRHLERVTKDTVFSLDLIMDVYDTDTASKLLETLDLGFQLLKKDYLGGGGTRGSGKVDISNLTVKKIVFNNDGSITTSDYSEYQFKSNFA